MRLADLQEYRELIYSPKSAPTIRTLRRNIDKNKIPGGCVIAGRYYVDLDEVERTHGIRKKIDHRRQELANSPLLKGLI